MKIYSKLEGVDSNNQVYLIILDLGLGLSKRIVIYRNFCVNI